MRLVAGLASEKIIRGASKRHLLHHPKYFFLIHQLKKRPTKRYCNKLYRVAGGISEAAPKMAGDTT